MIISDRDFQMFKIYAEESIFQDYWDQSLSIMADIYLDWLRNQDLQTPERYTYYDIRDALENHYIRWTKDKDDSEA